MSAHIVKNPPAELARLLSITSTYHFDIKGLIRTTTDVRDRSEASLLEGLALRSLDPGPCQQASQIEEFL